MMPTTFYDYKIIVELPCYPLAAVHNAAPQATFNQTATRLVNLPNHFCQRASYDALRQSRLTTVAPKGKNPKSPAATHAIR
jgi:hypothetical protein